jgi:serine protease Do
MWKWSIVAASLTLAAGGALVAAQAEPGNEAQKPNTVQKPDEYRAERKEGREIRKLAMPGGDDVEIGVSVRDVAANDASTAGAVVESVRDDSPAGRAGIRAGDVFVEFDGERVRSARQLSRLVDETPADRAVKAAVMRGGQRVELQITPEQGAMTWFSGEPGMRFERRIFPEHGMRYDMPHFDVRPDFDLRPGEGGRGFDLFVAPEGRGRLGVSIEALTPQLAEYFGTKNGVLVSSVREDSPASRAGLRAGDVITGVSGAAVNDPDDLVSAVRKADDGATLKIEYSRDHKSASTSVTLEPPERPKRPARPI